MASILGLCLSAATGCVYMNVTQPLDTDLAETRLGSKVGRSQAQAILGLVAWGDAGTQAAAKAAGIKTLNHADTQLFSILGFVYSKQTTIVYGD
jgi:hypothetical protein